MKTSTSTSTSTAAATATATATATSTITKYQMKSSAQRKVKALDGNMYCCDCGTSNPDWASISFGILFCVQCSGVHRSLGTHISYVRSIDMDSWSTEQVRTMKLGGNAQYHLFLQKYNPSIECSLSTFISNTNSNTEDNKNSTHTTRTLYFQNKYDNPVALLYKEILKIRSEEASSSPSPSPSTSSSSSTSTSTLLTIHDLNNEEKIQFRLEELKIIHQQQQEAIQARKKSPMFSSKSSYSSSDDDCSCNFSSSSSSSATGGVGNNTNTTNSNGTNGNNNKQLQSKPVSTTAAVTSWSIRTWMMNRRNGTNTTSTNME